VGAVAVALPVRLVVLLAIGDEIGEREAVMGGDEVDARRRQAAGLAEEIRGAGETGGEIAEPAVAAPEHPHVVAEAVVPFAPPGGKPAELVAARTDIPRLGDEAQPGQKRIGGDRLEEGCGGTEAGRRAAEDAGKVEAETVDAS